MEKDKTIDIKSNKKGTLKEINALRFGELSVSLGAGRRNKEDKIDHSVGIVLKKHLGDTIDVDDVLCTLYVNNFDFGFNQDEYFKII